MTAVRAQPAKRKKRRWARAAGGSQQRPARSGSRRTSSRFPRRARKRDELGLTVGEVLALAHAIFRCSLWRTVKEAAVAKQTASWEIVYAVAADLDAYRAFQAEHPGFSVEPQDEAAASDIVVWARERADTSDESFYETLAHALSAPLVRNYAFPTVCCAVATYYWQTGADGAGVRHVSPAHIGQVGRRDTFAAVTLKRVFYLPPKKKKFGPTYVLGFHDAAGNDVVWFSSRAPEDLQLTIGSTGSLTATVKRHDEWRGSKQTIVTRGKLALAA